MIETLTTQHSVRVRSVGSQTDRRIAAGYHGETGMLIRETTERILPYRSGELFEIASDVERYPEFVPGWIAVRVRDRHATGYCTDQLLGLGPLRLQFASATVLDPPRRILVSSEDTAFRQFGIEWLFEPRSDASCEVRVAVTLELRSRFSQAVFERLMPDIASRIMSAFEVRAAQRCGPKPAV